MNKGKRVAVAMSGGVDSAVAAALLQREGHDVTGVMMALTSAASGHDPYSRHDPMFEGKIEAAHEVSRHLDIPLHIVDLQHEFEREVIAPFVQEYMRGRTPNPCIRCNRHIKFGSLLQIVLALGFDCMATGHYARIERRNRRLALLKGLDSRKDQSYFLHTLEQSKLDRLLFPLGSYRKAEARRLAHEMGLPVWDSDESQEVCFIPDRDYRTYLARRAPSVPGEVVDTEGRVLGRHRGVASFTIGQRRGLGVSTGAPLYVLSVDQRSNRVVVGGESGLLADRVWIRELSFVEGQTPMEPVAVTAKIRHKSTEAPGMLCFSGDSRACLTFERPQRAVTPGQSVVFYVGDVVLGGGTIE
jgi:tRNA-specific 2-thiouridylase